MKKWFVFILAIIVIGGSTFPCCLEDDCQEIQIANSTKEESPEKGSCSPFLTCNGCTGFIHLTKQVKVPEAVAQIPSYQEELEVLFSNGYYSSFFQPPRMS